MARLPLGDPRFVLSRRALSDDVALNYVLADIPLLIVGVLAFCTFTFLAFVKRLDIALITLHLSIIVAFVAATLDLSQILQRGMLNIELGLQLDSVQSLIKTREVGYALSGSLRFFFFWIFVAEPPKAERDTPNARAGTHSGNWNAWGLIGVVLQWLTLSLTLLVFALQVTWRLDSTLNTLDKSTAVYSAESAIEVILSVVFSLKLLLNCVHCTIVSRWASIVDYSGFIVSLLFSFGFGIANLVHFEFTENSLGRFLQGVNFYILVLCSLLMVFLPPCKPKSGVPSFRALSPKEPASSFNVPPPDVSTPNLSAVQLRPDSPMTRRPSSTMRMSGWLATQRQRLSSLSVSHRRTSQDGMNAQLWNQHRAEHGLSVWEEPPKDPDVFKKAYPYPDSYLGTEPAQPPPIEKPKLEAPRLGRGFVKSTASRYSNLQSLDLSPPKVISRRSWQTGSPVFGLNGIVRPSTGESVLRSQGSVTVADSDQISDISSLFRKQEELDNSIAPLKLFEGPTGLPSSPSSSKPSATLSDFSLSNFPNPPRLDNQELDDFSESQQSPTPVRIAWPSHSNLPSISVDNVPFDLVPPRMPASAMEHNRTLSLPVSESADSDMLVSARTPRFDSQGTQYDVTSFIGNLTGVPSTDPFPPGHKKDFSDSSNTTDFTTVSSGSDDSERIATIVTLQQLNQTRASSPLARMPVISSPTAGMLPATRVMLPPTPKLDINKPRPAFPRLRPDVSPDTFERSRVVPSI